MLELSRGEFLGLISRDKTRTLLNPLFYTPRLASSRAMAPAPESSLPALSTSCRTDRVAVLHLSLSRWLGLEAAPAGGLVEPGHKGRVPRILA